MSTSTKSHRFEIDRSATPRRPRTQVTPIVLSIDRKSDSRFRNVEHSIMRLVLEQLSKVLEHDPQGRSQFVHSGGLALLQQMAEAPDSQLADVIDDINRQYPEEIVMHYSPSYSQKLLEKLDAQISQAVN